MSTFKHFFSILNLFATCRCFYLTSNTIKGTIIAFVCAYMSSSHFTSKECIWKSGTLWTKGITLSDQIEDLGDQRANGDKKKHFHQKYFRENNFHKNIFAKNLIQFFFIFYFSSKKIFCVLQIKKNMLRGLCSIKDLGSWIVLKWRSRWGRSPLAARRA